MEGTDNKKFYNQAKGFIDQLLEKGKLSDGEYIGIQLAIAGAVHESRENTLDELLGFADKILGSCMEAESKNRVTYICDRIRQLKLIAINESEEK